MVSRHWFYPSANSGKTLNNEIRKSLIGSLEWCFSQICHDSEPNIPSDWRPNVTDYGAYYDLAQSILSADGQHYDYLAHFQVADRFKPTITVEPVDGLPEFTSLCHPYYTDAEIACITRWLDLEPENAMSLSAVNDDQMKDASQKIEIALAFLRRLLPNFYAEFIQVTRQIILAKPSGHQKLTFGGVSSFALWGALALNVDEHQDWWLYVPRLIHEYSHSVLFGLARQTPLVLNEPSETYYSPLREELRPMDGIYHAAFVSAREAVALKCALDAMTSDSVRYDQSIRCYCQHVIRESTVAFWDCLGVIEEYGNVSDLGTRILLDTKQAMQMHELVHMPLEFSQRSNEYL